MRFWTFCQKRSKPEAARAERYLEICDIFGFDNVVKSGFDDADKPGFDDADKSDRSQRLWGLAGFWANASATVVKGFQS